LTWVLSFLGPDYHISDTICVGVKGWLRAGSRGRRRQLAILAKRVSSAVTLKSRIRKVLGSNFGWENSGIASRCRPRPLRIKPYTVFLAFRVIQSRHWLRRRINQENTSTVIKS
jgi:hypothetical protein